MRSSHSGRRPAAGCVLVIGAAHVDVIADYIGAQQRASDVDKTGVMHYSVGGTGYNIAINLGEAGVPVALMTVLRPNSYASVWIRERLGRARVADSLIEFDPGKPDSGFVAIRRDQELEAAVTATAVGSHSFSASALDSAIAGARLVAIDCNLAPDQIALIVDRAAAARRPVVAAAVSDSKVARLVLRFGKAAQLLDLVALNERELAAAGWTGAVPPASAADADGLCTLLGARRVVVTLGAHGYVVAGKDGILAFPAPAVPVVSSTGAGDALLSAILAYWHSRGRVDFNDMAPMVAMMVSKVLAEEGATRGSIASEADLGDVTKWLAANRTLGERFGTSDVISAAAGVAAVLIGLGAWMWPQSAPNPPSAVPAYGLPAASGNGATSAPAAASRSASGSAASPHP